MERVLNGSHSFTCRPRVHPLTEWTLSAFDFRAEASFYFPTPEGRLSWPGRGCGAGVGAVIHWLCECEFNKLYMSSGR